MDLCMVTINHVVALSFWAKQQEMVLVDMCTKSGEAWEYCPREALRRTLKFYKMNLAWYSLDEYGCGSNVHISLSKNGINVFKASDGSSQYDISKIGESFMSGVLDHLPSVFAFTAPHPTSYERLFSKDWNGRVAISYVLFDACTNPYLGLASILTAGIDGLRKKLSLPTPVDRETRGVNQEDYRRLPDCLTDSLNALEEDTNIFDRIPLSAEGLVTLEKLDQVTNFSFQRVVCNYLLGDRIVRKFLAVVYESNVLRFKRMIYGIGNAYGVGYAAESCVEYSRFSDYVCSFSVLHSFDTELI
ncbi:hypothetical protein HAX54_031506 [Datura stramonium]|uniref:GS catalytic domain-containing protein n=1 Tax=Datura stramonium TaxID=4076 RepID=A0ABS8RH31_DATST|nr:hypothetical protein [Datura stramonium]